MHAKYEVSISYISKFIAKVKVDNRQTDKQTDKHTDKQTGQKQYAPIIRFGGIKRTKTVVKHRTYFKSYEGHLENNAHSSIEFYTTIGEKR